MVGHGPVRAELPDTVVGIGNAGKKVVYRYLETEWILEEALEPRGSSLPDFNAFVVDTAMGGEKEDDEDRESELNEFITEVSASIGRDEGLVDSELTYLNPVDQTPNEYLSPQGLTGGDTVRRIADAADIDSWWLELNETMTGSGDYGTGVVRRRGLSKALYHASQTGEDPIDRIVAEAGDSVAMVIGLGGGTGSGMFIDVAQRLAREDRTIHLYGVLPALDENTRKRANAFIALNEIEYLSLTNQNPFTNVVLFPFERARKMKNKEVFHDAVAQAIVANANMDDELTSFLDSSSIDGPPRYAPFTVAVPKTLHYPIGEVEESKARLDEYREAREEFLDTEHELYDALSSFVEDHVGGRPWERLRSANRGDEPVDDDGRFTLSPDKTGELLNRLDDVRGLLNDPEFQNVSYQSLQDWQTAMDGFWDNVETHYGDLSGTDLDRELVVQVSRSGANRDVDEREEYSGAEESDQLFGRMLQREFEAIRKRANLWRSVNLVDDEAVRRGMLNAMDHSMAGIGGADDVRRAANEMEQRLAAVERNVETLERVEADLRERRDEYRDEWWDAVEGDCRAFVTVRSNREEIADLAASLDAELERAVTYVRETDPELFTEPFLEFDRFEELNGYLERMGVEPIAESYLRETLRATAEAKRIWAERQSLGLVDKWFGNPDELAHDYDVAVGDVDPEIVSVTPSDRHGFESTDFRCDYVGLSRLREVDRELERQAEELPAAVAAELESALSDLPVDEEWYREHDALGEWESSREREDPPAVTWTAEAGSHATELRSELDAVRSVESVEELRRRLDGRGDEESGVVAEAFDSAFVDPIRAEIESLRRERDEAAAARDAYLGLTRIVEGEGDDLYHATQPEAPGDDGSPTSQDEVYRVIRQPEGETQLRDKEHIGETDFFSEGSDEFGAIKWNFENFAEDVARAGELTAIEEGKIEVSGDDDEVDNNVYRGMFVANVFMSRAFDAALPPGGEVFESAEEILRKRGELLIEDGANGYGAQSVPFGGEWDLSMTTFVGGLFLENLAPVVHTNRGYKSAYERQRENLLEDVRVRHALGLDGTMPGIAPDAQTGGYLWREETFTVGNYEDHDRFLDMSADEVVETFTEEFVETETFESTIDFGAGADAEGDDAESDCDDAEANADALGENGAVDGAVADGAAEDDAFAPDAADAVDDPNVADDAPANSRTPSDDIAEETD